MHPLVRESNDGPPGGKGRSREGAGGTRGHLRPVGSDPDTPLHQAPSRPGGSPQAPLPWSSPPARAAKVPGGRWPCSNLTVKFAGQQGSGQLGRADGPGPTPGPSVSMMPCCPPPTSLCEARAAVRKGTRPPHKCRTRPQPALAGTQMLRGAHAPQHVAQVLGHQPCQVEHYHGRLRERRA